MDLENKKVLNDTQEQIVDAQNEEIKKDDLMKDEESEKLLDDEDVEDFFKGLEDDEEDDDEEEGDKKDDEEEENSGKEEKPTQSKEENSKYAAARRDAENKVKEQEKKLNKVLQTFGFKSIEEYEKKIDSKEEFATEFDQMKNYIAKKEINEEMEKLAKIKFDEDVKELTSKYPHLDVSKLGENESFMSFADGKFGKKKLVDIYDDYNKFFKGFNIKQNKDIDTNRATGGTQNSGFLGLNANEQRTLEEWNRKNPDMIMTPDEFLKYRR